MQILSADTILMEPDDIAYCQGLAAGRNGKAPDINNNLFSDHTSEGAHLVGVIGEHAFAGWAGDRVDERFYRAGDPGFDAEYAQMRVDVKTRVGQRRDLALYPDLSDLRADIAVLVWWDDPHVILVGWADQDDIRSMGKKMEFIKGQPRLVVPWEKLNPLWTL